MTTSIPATETAQERFQKKTGDFINRLQTTLKVTDEELRDILKVSFNELYEITKGRTDLDIFKLCSLSQTYKFNLDAFFDDKVDFETLRQHKMGNEQYLPEKYIVGAFSKKRLIHTVLDYVENHYNWRMKENILSYFQMSGAIYTNPDDKINVYFFEDVLKFLLKLGLTHTDIARIGLWSAITTKGTIMEQELSKSRSPKELFEKYFQDIILFIERNNKYRIINLNETSCEVESHEIPDNLDIFKVKYIGGPLRCLYRSGALGAATTYLGGGIANVVETTCVHRGDSVCTFRIDFANAGIKRV